jgi:hypothetical protein
MSHLTLHIDGIGIAEVDEAIGCRSEEGPQWADPGEVRVSKAKLK